MDCRDPSAVSGLGPAVQNTALAASELKRSASNQVLGIWEAAQLFWDTGR